MGDRRELRVTSRYCDSQAHLWSCYRSYKGGGGGRRVAVSPD